MLLGYIDGEKPMSVQVRSINCSVELNHLVTGKEKSLAIPDDVKADNLLGWNPVCLITYNRDSWVKLNQAPNPYAEEEALLLCEKVPGVWVSWIPGHGEMLLDKSEFYC
ncbi:hypothetical protein VKI22_02640 [Cyanobacterium aponinum UTEX 3221]|uniref:hypothetical protein n=1 Tax=Cyanobacterium aponinum TaxID=379064 RepID=UPI002B4BFF57|nr:hypothetical protein [Cyanobacterium aponinum]WRL39013.1 hypothetical protein VKI22_02640 [Cyanobacterium aponinum UTEX 3221]